MQLSTFDLPGMTKSNFPIVVLTHSDGSKLLNTLDHYGDSVLARLDAESDVDAIVEPTQTASIQPRQSPGTSRKKSDKESSGRWPFLTGENVYYSL